MKRFNFGKLFLVLAELCAIILACLILVEGAKHTLSVDHVLFGSLFICVAPWIDNMHSDMGWRK